MSFKREIDLEKRLNAISSKAVREPSEEEFTNPFKSSVSKSKSTSIEQIDNDDMRQLTIDAQLAKIATNAIVDKLGTRPSKIKSEVTKEMILDYQNEMLNPIEVGRRKFKYHPSSVDIDLETYVPIHDVRTEEEILELRQLQRQIGAEINALQRDQDRTSEELYSIRSDYDAEMSDIVLRGVNVEQQAILTERFTTGQDAIQGRLDEIAYEIAQREGTIAVLQSEIDENDRKISENQAEESSVKRANAQKLKAHEDDLNLLNRGKMNITKQPNETDEEYAIRLFQTGQTTIDEDAMQNSANLYNRDKLRELLLEIVRDTTMISSAVRFLTDDQVFKVNQKWPQIKRDFLKVYGFDNQTIKERDLIYFFEQEVEPIIDAINKGRPEPEEVVVEGRLATAEVIGPPEKKTYAELQKLVEDKKGGRKQLRDYHKKFNPNPVEKRSAEDTLQLILEEDLVLDKAPDGSNRRIPSPIKSPPLEQFFGSSFSATFSLEELKKRAEPFLRKLIKSQQPIADGGADEETIRKAESIIKFAGRAVTSPNIDKFYENLDAIEAEEAGIIITSLPDIYPRAITGSGLKPIKHDIPNLIEFGKVKISPRKLYYNNTLAIKHKSGNSLGGLPNVQVSDKFVSIIMNLLKGQKPTLKDFTQLDLNEKGVYDSLVYIAGLQKEVDNNFGETKQHLKNRLELVEGEIGAGNTNPKLKKELHSLLGKMAHTGMIGYGDAKRHYLNVTR